MGYIRFMDMIEMIKFKYKKDDRTVRLSGVEKNKLIKKQGNMSPETGAPIFIGDDIEVDHIMPIAKGGKDARENLQILHKRENRSKGTK